MIVSTEDFWLWKLLIEARNNTRPFFIRRAGDAPARFPHYVAKETAEVMKVLFDLEAEFTAAPGAVGA